jgi:hypothetical protein
MDRKVLLRNCRLLGFVVAAAGLLWLSVPTFAQGTDGRSACNKKCKGSGKCVADYRAKQARRSRSAASRKSKIGGKDGGSAHPLQQTPASEGGGM